MTMDMPSAAQLRRLHDELSSTRARLAAALRRQLREGAGDVPPHLHVYLADEVDPAEASEELADEVAWLGHEATTLRQTDAALRRMAAGTYGTCTRCGAAIPLERLLALPSADRCLACQAAAEQTSAPSALERAG
jgi:RNA polymerase-binding transcription factor DksA